MFCGSRQTSFGGRGGKMALLIVKVAYPWSETSEIPVIYDHWQCDVIQSSPCWRDTCTLAKPSNNVWLFKNNEPYLWNKNTMRIPRLCRRHRYIFYWWELRNVTVGATNKSTTSRYITFAKTTSLVFLFWIPFDKVLHSTYIQSHGGCSRVCMIKLSLHCRLGDKPMGNPTLSHLVWFCAYVTSISHRGQ